MKNLIKFIGLALFTAICAFHSCKKVPVPEPEVIDYSGQTGIVRDTDGNSYPTIGFKRQIWMAENLKTTRYNDGRSISNVTDNLEWMSHATQGYCWYNNDEIANKNRYGALYNWYAVNTQKLCPAGWHVPLDSEWETLIFSVDSLTQKYSSVGFMSGAGGRLSENGFTLELGGCRRRWEHGEFAYLNQRNVWWASDSSETNYSLRYLIIRDDGTIWKFDDRKMEPDTVDGFSVRCIKDSLTIK